MFHKLICLLSFTMVIVLAGEVVNADPLRQDTGPDGIVSVEAENFDENTPEGVHEWAFFTEPIGFSGIGFMRAIPDGGGGGNPRLDFEIDFVKTGPHYVWVRGYRTSGTDDSCHAGLNGDETNSDRIQAGGTNNTWEWSNQRRDNLGPAFVEVPSTGVHTLNVRMREDGWRFDKVVLTTNPDYRPTDEGPPESHRGARLKAYAPIPDDGATHEDNWVSLNWSAGETAVSHDVYFGDNFNDVNDGTADTFRGNQTTVFYVAGFPGFAYPDGLPTGITYYWRIDEVEADGTTHKGDIWTLVIPPTTAHNPIPADEAILIDPDTELNWTPGLGSKLHHLYFGESFDDVNAAAPNTYKGPISDTSFTPSTLTLDTAYYWRIDEFSLTGTATGDVWSFRTIPEIPIDNPNLIGWWRIDADSGTRVIDWSGHSLHGSLEESPQWSDGFDGIGLELDGTDFVELGTTDLIGSDVGSVSLWIKTIQNSTGMIFYGTSGSSGNGFGDEPELHINMMDNGGVEFYIEGGDNDANPEGPVVNDDSWHHITATWDINAEAKLYVDGSESASVPHDANDFTLSGTIRLGRPNGGERFYNGLIDDIRLYNYVLSSDEIASIMRGDVALAWNPKPASGSTSNIDNVTQVSWSAGDNASQHDVYFGTDKDAVTDADETITDIYRGRQGATNFTPTEGIGWGQSYYWRIDEYNTDGTISKGRVWSFAIADYIVVDDFESYNDLDPADPDSNRIYDAWIDGFDNPAANGSIVGYANAPFAEQTMVHGGSQSMPMSYDNAVGLSEATLTLTYPRDWSRHGIGILSLWFMGNPAGFLEDPVGTITMSAGGNDIWNTSDQFRYAYKQLSGTGSITTQVLSVQNTDPWAKAGVMIRQTLDPGSKFAAVYITPNNGCRFQARKTPGSNATSDTADNAFTPEQTAITAPYWIRIERDAADNFNGYYSSDGVSWQAMPWNPQKISMPSNVFIGLAFTSHNTSVIGTAEFSNVTTTGSVSPSTWTHEAIGVEMASNDPEPMYVALNGNAVVQHDNPNAALISDWTEWRIDLQAFADQGINLANINTLTIGFGDKKNPKAGGSGSAFFDDIQLQRP